MTGGVLWCLGDGFGDGIIIVAVGRGTGMGLPRYMARLKNWILGVLTLVLRRCVRQLRW